MLEGLLLHYPTYSSDFSYEAYFETEDLLEELSMKIPALVKADLVIAPEGMNGLIVIDLRDNPLSNVREKEFKRNFNKKLEEGKAQGYWKYIAKPVFFNRIINSKINEIAASVKTLKEKIKGKWRIKINTRHRIPRRETIEEVAKHITYPVDLENPKYIVKIECLGKISGVAVEIGK